MAINLSSIRTELEIKITDHLVSNNPCFSDRWLPVLFVGYKTKKLSEQLVDIIQPIIKIPCIIEIGGYYQFVTGSYLDKVIRITIPDNFFKDYFNGHIINSYIKSLVCPIVDIALHELVHYNQDKGAGFKNIKKGKIPAHLSGSSFKYFSSDREIEAWAIYTASELARKSKRKDLLFLLSNKKGQEVLTKHSKIFGIYKKIFESSSNRIWKRYLTKVMKHLNTI